MEINWKKGYAVLAAFAVANYFNTKVSNLVVGETAEPSSLTPVLLSTTDKGDFAVDVTPLIGEVRAVHEGEAAYFTYVPTAEGIKLSRVPAGSSALFR